MSKTPTLASVNGTTLSGAQQKTFNTGLLAAMKTAGMQEGSRTTITANATLTVTQCGLLLVDCTGGNVALTLPTSGSTTDDAVYLVRRLDSTTNTLTLTRGGADTVEGAATAISVAAQGVIGVQLPAGGTDWKVFSRNGGTQAGARAAIGSPTSAELTAAASGTADAITATFSPNITALTNGLRVRLTGLSSNTLAAPTLAAGTTAATTIKNPDGSPLVPGQITPESDFIYSTAFAAWLLSTVRQPKQIQTLPTPTFNAGAMTIPAASYTQDFRSATAGSGAVTTVQATASALVVPSGATLGLVSAIASELALVALFPSAGVIEYGIVNTAGGTDLSETGVISTTAISAGSGTAGVVYSTTARSGVPYRVLGVYRSTQTTAGTWAQAMSLIQGVGGQALTAMSSLGYGQTWQDLTGSRAFGTTYYNTTGRPISLSVWGSVNTGANLILTVDGIQVAVSAMTSIGVPYFVFGIIPPGKAYQVSVSTGTPTLSMWAELR